MSRSVRPSDGRISAVRAVHDVAAVEFGRHLHGQRAAAQRGLGDGGVRRGRREVAAHAHEHLGAPVAHGPDGVDGVDAVLARADDAELGVQCGQELLGHLLPDAHRAVALHVGVAAHRAQSGAGFADHAAHQQHVGDLGDHRHRVLVLGQAHRPAHDRALGGDHILRDPLELRAVDAGGLEHGVEVDRRGSAPRIRRSSRSARR